MTTGISLVRENTVSMQPPRALWVSFPLGRPLGKPNDVAFQHRVIDAALELLNEESGPVLTDYPEDAPNAEVGDAPSCPVSFVKHDSNTDTWESALHAEVQSLTAWHDLGRRRRNGRTVVGVSGFSMLENTAKLGALLDQKALPVTELTWFKGAIEDAKVFYLEALSAQPGAYHHDQLEKIFWTETTMGAAILSFNDLFAAHSELSFITRIIVPRRIVNMINTDN